MASGGQGRSDRPAEEGRRGGRRGQQARGTGAVSVSPRKEREYGSSVAMQMRLDEAAAGVGVLSLGDFGTRFGVTRNPRRRKGN